MSREPCPALWTDGRVTIVLPLVTVAYWASRSNDPDMVYDYVTPDKADRFVIEYGASDSVFDESDDNWREIAVDFLRALNFYWETRV